MRVSVLDTSPIVRGSTARQALRNTLDLAVLADELGFHRYWVPEHHSMRGVASSAPAVVVGRIADVTGRIRVGAGGVLLPNHAPIVVAEQFGTLEVFHPGRIDLGIGRALGGPQPAADAVRSERERTAKSFEAQVRELLQYFEGGNRVRAVPAVGNRPPVWLLGSSGHSAELATSLGLGYAFAHHLEPENAAAALGQYRGSQTLVSVSVIVADTDAEAEYLAGSTRLKVLSRVRGRRIQLPSAADAAAYPYTDDDRAEIAARSGGVLVGSPDTVRELLQAVVEETGTTELMLTTPVHDHAARRRSYELVAKIAPALG
ncbi:LLM class flavin-dependent oxidoreductase [Kutzneria buriramensis]|uniref:Luciferase family oxidoreductase group 1 n=1 Tax=Kutzneria buriramensis TaxID=1045776 RepID=A0A3E0HQ24_9PSEU|nr:LLM class flavin-dependent oxidoreductase [Kutzneria buriramensis]REH48524.1 luciferase family oxidoreductase group 1 [Kutzneria buriramensis]